MAVKSRNNFDYRGIADLEELRQRDSSLSTFIDQLVEIRQSFNGALAVEGQNIAGDAPHSPLYLDFIDSDRSNTVAFKDANPLLHRCHRSSRLRRGEHCMGARRIRRGRIGHRFATSE